MEHRPWDTGDIEANWAGYLIPGTGVLRNRLGITDAERLLDAENDLVEIRIAELRHDPAPVPRTYDLPHLTALHRHLFQDVFDWAGELRTVGIGKGGESFIPPLDIVRPVEHVADRIARAHRLRGMVSPGLEREVAYLFDYLNFAHPFREGNGRTQREFFDQLLSETGRGLAWDRIGLTDLHDACHAARADGELAALIDLLRTIIDDEPAYYF